MTRPVIHCVDNGDALNEPSPLEQPAEQFLLDLQRRAASVLGESEPRRSRALTGPEVAHLLGAGAAELSPEDYQRHAALLALLPAAVRAGDQPRPFEDPLDTEVWTRVLDHVLAVMRARALPLPSRPVVGTLPTHAFEPLIVLAPGRAGVVLGLDPDTSVFLDLLGKAIARLFLSASDGRLGFTPCDWALVLDSNHPAACAFTDMVLATLAGRSAWARPYLPGSAYEVFASDLRDLMAMFLVGQACAHVSAGHVDRAPRAAFELPGSEIETPVFSLGEEFRADLLAFDLLVAHVRAHERPVAVAGLAVESLLATLSILESARALLGAGSQERVVPPSAGCHVSRQHLVRCAVGMRDGVDGMAAEFVRSVQPAFDLLWVRVEQALLDPEVSANVRRPGLYGRPWSQAASEYGEHAERVAKATAIRHFVDEELDDTGL
jgi:hypothetical protein